MELCSACVARHCWLRIQRLPQSNHEGQQRFISNKRLLQVWALYSAWDMPTDDWRRFQPGSMSPRTVAQWSRWQRQTKLLKNNASDMTPLTPSARGPSRRMGRMSDHSGFTSDKAKLLNESIVEFQMKKSKSD